MREIVIDNPNTFIIPRVEVEPGYIAHVRCWGARFHVKSYHLIGERAFIRCSEPKCIVNKDWDEYSVAAREQS